MEELLLLDALSPHVWLGEV